jgi:Ca2+-binding RTX toxin-like protein
MAIVTGTNASDPGLNGTNLADQIFGLGGNDTLIGLDGSDVLEGGAGADELFGSAGFDYASYKSSSTGVLIGLDNFYADYGDAAGDHLYSIEGVIGSAFNDALFGDDQRNILRGGGGADDLYGLAGKDRLEGGVGTDLLEGGAGADDLRGGDGIDTVSYVSSLQGVRVDLAAGTGLGGDAEGDRLSGIENVTGTMADDVIVGNGGANALYGWSGCDEFVGGGGADRFVYLDRYDSATGGTDAPDLIRDFSRAQGDRIDLRGVDANEQLDGNQACRFVGQGPFTGTGQVRFFHEEGATFVEVNTTDAHAGADMLIKVEGLLALQSGDFLL